MKRTKILSLALVIVLCMAPLSLIGCEDIEDLPSELAKEGLVINAGDTNHITIEAEGDTGTLAASKALLSAVSIYASFEIEYPSYFGAYYETETHAGSGVIYKMDKQKGEAYIITNYHVIYDPSSTSENGISSAVTAYLYGQESSAYGLKAEYIGGSMLYDIAVLKVSGSKTLIESCAAPVSVASSDEISVLESAIVIGNPAKLGISATLGSISVDSEYITMVASDNRTATTMRVIRTDAAVNSGNSGGGLFNTKGDLIGIVNAKISSSSIENIGYAIPSNIAVRVADNIINSYDGESPAVLKRCILGITSGTAQQRVVYDSETGKIQKIETVAVAKIEESSLADGVVEVGDIIVSAEFSGTVLSITKAHQLSEFLITARPGDTVKINLQRDGEDLSVSFTFTDGCVAVFI